MANSKSVKENIVAFFSMEPAVVRGFLVALSGVVTAVLHNSDTFDSDLINSLLVIYTSLSALVAALFIRPAVTPNDKVVLTTDDAHAAAANEGNTTAGPLQVPNDEDGDLTGQNVPPVPDDTQIPDPGSE